MEKVFDEIYLLIKDIEFKWENKDCIVGAQKFADLLKEKLKK